MPLFGKRVGVEFGVELWLFMAESAAEAVRLPFVFKRMSW
jgi:hypothetical protein